MNAKFLTCNCRDNYGATPKDRLSEEEEYFHEIIDLLNKNSKPVPQQQSVPKPTIKVSILAS